MANRRFIDFPIASTVGDNDIVLIWQNGLNKQTTKATFLSGLPENLDELNDVAISSLTNGQILRYDSVSGKWENTDQGNLDLNDLNDVSIVSPSNGQVLVYNSTTSKWENSSGGFVPYIGAVTTVDLGAQGLRAGYIRFDTSVVSVPDEQGLVYWDSSRSTAALIMNGVLQHIGQDTFFYVKNSTGSSIPKGTSVRFDGTDGASGHLKIAPFLANGTYPSNYFMGVTAETIANGAFGQVMHFGELDGINTSSYTAGALLYASTTVAGGFQTTAPVAPNNIVLIAAAINSKNNGTILVRTTYGSNINTDEGVKITTPTTGQLLQLQAGGLWENKTKAQVLGGTSSQFVKGDGSLDSTIYVSGSGTSGQIAYFNGTSSITGESSLFWDATNDRLGIGTASPVYNLDLLASSSANSDIFRAGMTGVSNGFTVQRVSSSFTYTFLNGHLLIGNSANSGQQLQVTGTAKITDILTIGTTDNSFIYESGGSLILQTGASADLVIPSSGASTFNSGLNVVGDLTLSSANPFLYGGTAAGSLGLSNIGGQSYIRVFGASHSTTPNVTQFVNAGSTSLTIASTGAATFSGSVSTPHSTKTANYTLTETDYTVGFDCASNRTATLPDATTCAGRIYVIYQYNTGSGARSVTLDGNGSQTINGVTTYSLSPFCEYSSVMIQSNGANWIIISSNFTTDCL